MKKNNIVHEYLFYQEKYEKIYGKDNTIVFLQVGGFYESYSIFPKRGFDLSKISEICNLVLTRKDKKVEVVDEKNPYMIGFNITALDKFLKILVDNGFTVIIIEQTTPPPVPKREVTGIYSSGTYINDSNSLDSNNVVCLFIEDEKQLNGTYLTCIGMSAIDLSTGECSIYEVSSIIGDEKYAIDETFRFIISKNPKEIIIARKEIPNISIKKEDLILNFELENKKIHYLVNSQINKNFSKLSYQNEFLGKIYKDYGMETPIEYLDLEKVSYARLSFIILLDFAYKHNENLVNSLDKPNLFTNNKHLILGNNAIFQLNLLENNSIEISNIKFKCLFDVINQTSTAIGRRFLKHSICQPLNDKNIIELRYNCIDELIKNDLYLTLEKHLGYISDIEKLARKIFLAFIHPYEFFNLIESFNGIEDIIKLLTKTKFNSSFVPENKYIKQLNEFLKICNDTFDTNELKKQNLNDVTGSFFKKGVYPSIDELQDKVVNDILFMEEICKKLSSYIDDNGKFCKKKNTDNEEENLKIQLKRNDRDGYYLCLSKRRAHILKDKIDKLPVIKINDNLSLDPKKLEFKELVKGNTKIFFKDLENKSDNVISMKEKLIKLVKDKYIALLILYGQKFKEMFRQISKFIAQIDFIKSCAKAAKLYKYCKPEFITNKEKKQLDNGFIDCKKIRHPIVERIRTEVEYISHDICLGKPPDYVLDDLNVEGMLLFGLNSAGKSTLMKAIGLNLIMAQCGMYVAAQEFKYSPYESLYARITGNDNLFKGQSSFTLEMTELKAILKRAGPKTLVLGDELTRGTEHISGNALVAASIINLSKSNSSFIFATHLHEIANMKRIQELKNVKLFHLTVNYDAKNDLLIFDRLLKPGSGDPIYGLTVARYILKDNDFIKLAQEIKNELLNIPNKLLNDKTSNYNAQIYMHECSLCGKTVNENSDFDNSLDSHHIIEQNKFNKDKFTEGKSIKKDQKNNILVICKLCHHKIHDTKELDVKGYLDTSKGRKILVKNKGKTLLKNKNIILTD